MSDADASISRRAHSRRSSAARQIVRTPRGDTPGDSLQVRREMLAKFCQLMGERLTGKPMAANESAGQSAISLQIVEGLTPRLRQTLERLLAGDAEKEIAAHLGVSRHTVHAYVKGLYRHFEVNSRGELLARFVGKPPHQL